MIVHFLHHWVFEDIWVPVWPNWAADVILGILVYIFGRRELRKLRHRLEKNHLDMKSYVDAAVSEIIRKPEPK
jgi:hypothetical protein